MHGAHGSGSVPSLYSYANVLGKLAAGAWVSQEVY